MSALPSYLQIEAAGACNLRCAMCAIRVRRDNRPLRTAYMGQDLFRRIVDQVEGLERLHLQGLGEPLLNPHFFDMVRYAAEKGAAVTASSNLTLLDGEKAERLVDSGLQCLHVSIDGANAATYEAIRRGASFEGLLSALRRLDGARKSASGLPTLRMTVVLMKRNLAELSGLVELASRFGMEQVFVQHLCHSFTERHLPAHYAPMRKFVERQTVTTLPASAVEASFDAARKAAERHEVDLRLPPLGKARTHKAPSCDWPMTGLYVSFQGYVMPCCMVSTPDRASFGSAAREDLAAIWDGEAARSFRAALASPDPPSVCTACAIYQGTF